MYINSHTDDFVVMRTIRIYSFNNIKMYNTLLLMIVTIQYNRIVEPILSK